MSTAPNGERPDSGAPLVEVRDLVVHHGQLRALASRPRLLLLDEVAGGLTDPEVAQLVEIVRGINAEGIAVIWIEHVVRALTATVSRLICLAGGQFVGDGEPAAVLANPAVREVFLGSELTASLSGGTLTAEVGDPGEGA